MSHDEVITLSGRVEDIFAHRFTLATQEGKRLVDLTPKGEERIRLRPGDEIVVEGEPKPSEIKAHRITRDGEIVDIEPGKSHRGHDPKSALKAVRDEGFHMLAPPRAKPKHFEILARRDGEIYELHVEPDGHIRKRKPASEEEPKWTRA